jgi:DNA-binding NarL/FixJ family response regulator
METSRGVLVCDDVADVRGLLREALDDEPGMHVVGEAENGRECVTLAAALRPHVVLLDLSMPELDGLEVIPRLLESSPDTRIVIFSGFGSGRMADLALSLGAARYVEKGTPLDQVVALIREVGEARR